MDCGLVQDLEIRKFKIKKEVQITAKDTGRNQETFCKNDKRMPYLLKVQN